MLACPYNVFVEVAGLIDRLPKTLQTFSALISAHGLKSVLVQDIKDNFTIHKNHIISTRGYLDKGLGLLQILP